MGNIPPVVACRGHLNREHHLKPLDFGASHLQTNPFQCLPPLHLCNFFTEIMIVREAAAQFQRTDASQVFVLIAVAFKAWL